MNTIQIIAAVTAFIGLLGAIIAGAWLNQRGHENTQRGLERQMEAFRNEITATMNALRADVRADIVPLKQTVEKIDRQLEAIVSRLILPGKGD
jgi:hypothetical protein